MKQGNMFMATGRRKCSVARVIIKPGTGKIVVNSKPANDYFPRESHRLIILQPLESANLAGKFDIYANIRGGGISGQADALKHGISRALIKSDGSLRAILKKAGFLTRDPRMRERKKYGRKRARRRFQYTKR